MQICKDSRIILLQPKQTMSLSYADEKFSAAIRSLAIGIGPIKERLIDACTYDLIHIQAERDVPENMREDFEELINSVTKDSPTLANPNDGKIQATIKNMSEDAAVEIATEILSFAYRIEGALEDERKNTSNAANRR